MLETEGLQVEGEIVIVNGPFTWKIEKFPFSAALLAAVIMSVQLFPFLSFFFGIPNDLRVGTKKNVFSPSFQLFSTGGVYNFIIFPVICYPHSPT